MAISFEPVPDQPNQNNWDFLSRQFPLASQHLKDSAVTSAKIATGAVTEVKLSLRIVRGEVSAAGAVSRGSGFTVVRNSAGNYTVTFSTAFSAAPIVVASFIDGGIFAARVSATSTTATTIITFNSVGTSTDSAFQFHAISV